MPTHPDPPSPDEFERLARQRPAGTASELLDFFRHSKRWWIPPIVIILLLFGAVVILGASGAAPFIYTLF
jgi:hypothetical protein